MTDITYIIEFDGYWRKANIEAIPEKQGIFCIYECTYNIVSKTVTIHQLLYLGTSIDVRSHIKMHLHWDNWGINIKEGNEMCFSFGIVKKEINNTILNATADELANVLSALTYKQKPPYNSSEDFVYSFPYDKTTVISKGRSALINTNFTVDRK